MRGLHSTRRGHGRVLVRHWPVWLALLLLCVAGVAAAWVHASASATAPTPTATITDTAMTAAPLTSPAAPSPIPQETTPVYGYRVASEYPHDPSAFTQGLVYEGGFFYEGTGLTLGRSSLRKVALETGEVLQIHSLASEFFGEGISVVGNRIWQLTWQNHVAFLYDKETFEQLNTVPYPTEGWGLAYDGERLIMSDGTATLYFRDPDTFEVLGQVAVYDEHGPVVRLNELEYIDGRVFANVWMTDRIAIIDLATGRVEAWLDLTGLLDASELAPEVDVLNGIAYDSAGERLFVTGKLWPALYEIEIIGGDRAAFLPLVSRR
jgi:glutamine cyclotransferase